MKPTAVILTSGMLATVNAKTAHGLIRSSDKYQILGILDDQHAGKDAGLTLDGKHRNIPVYKDLKEAKSQHPSIDYAILGVATPGGVIPEAMQRELLDIIDSGISIINGLHTFLSDIPMFAEKAKTKGVKLLDIRKAKPRSELSFWTGGIFKVKSPIISVLGTDCALGKRTTTRIIVDGLKEKGIKAEMISTGQTGLLQNDGYGFIFDSTLNDFVSGELEKAILDCYAARNPEVMLLEGQAAPFNPSGPCGSEYLISGNAKKVILQHAPARKYFKGWEELQLEIPSLERHMKLFEAYDSEVIGITLNGSTGPNTPPISKAALEAYKETYHKMYGIPVLDAVYDDISPIVDQVITVIEKNVEEKAIS